eukprot:CAMPEP_0194580910 /NCGR_PEP_ID=MMETSP0292-20121207/14525_1 /TAXON_ID=39354 /ORGANISM="Heterosigma akashiwo, Strain CCMP2393" /LENGTH=122 /DNA_ID=CAMNT_0039434431 /DNA_START=837 /DNA_END=1205 /DNA_ORIENTATION=+
MTEKTKRRKEDNHAPPPPLPPGGRSPGAEQEDEERQQPKAHGQRHEDQHLCPETSTLHVQILQNLVSIFKRTNTGVWTFKLNIFPYQNAHTSVGVLKKREDFKPHKPSRNRSNIYQKTTKNQ